ncbi:MAG: ABC transporter substrate-binding protein [Streptosporangiaceae bacterium]|nr:ABC transporter substrate-binding protein [Streptosporangiaceae bacterium]MBV9858367.1 ABC transporter substrate-binding protein [Streptosporangiaceae bacterium]
MRLAWAGVRVSALRMAPAVLAVTVLASGCHVPGTGAPGAAPGRVTITVAVVPGIDNAPLRVAVQDGLFRQHGLNVAVKDYQSLGAEFQALTDGQAQIAVGDYADFFYEQAVGGASLRLIADGYDAAPNSVAILTLPGSGITTPQQLQGQPGSVATPPAQMTPYSAAVPYSIQTLAAEEVLQNDGVSPSSVNWTQMRAQDMIGALRSGRVKAILATEPYILEAEEQLGAVEVVDASSGVTSGLPMSGYFSLASYAHANAPAVQAFQRALAAAQSDCAQRGPVQAVLSHLTGMSMRDAALVTLGTYPTSLNVGQIQRVAVLMYDSGMISNPVSVSSMTSG